MLRQVGDFYNGGTARWRGELWHGATDRDGNPLLLRSQTGLTWEKAGRIPEEPGWRAITSDLYLRPVGEQLRIYFAGRPGLAGADIGSALFSDRGWNGFRVILARMPGWDSLDLGEPAVFSMAKRRLMFYAGVGHSDRPRHIGLAYKKGDAWLRCPGPFIAAGGSTYPKNAIDPEPLMVGDRLYLFFGGGNRPSLGGNMAGRVLLRVYDLPS